MEDETLFRLALIVSMTGILLLFIISDTIKINKYNIKELTKDEIEKTVIIRGEITRITETPGLIILNLQDSTGEITGIMFKDETVNISIGSNVEVQGKVREYKKRLEIEVEQLRNV